MSLIHCSNFPGYERVAEKYGISAATSIPAGARLIVTSGHVGMDDEMNMKVDLQEQMEVAFTVRRGRSEVVETAPSMLTPMRLKNVEKSILACDPDLTPDQIWAGVYQITTYHVGGVGEQVTDLLASVAERHMGKHRPAWAAVGVEALAAGKFEMSVSAAFPGKT